MSEPLAGLGIGLTEGYGEDQLRLRPDLWVIGNVITRGTPLMEAILDRGELYASGPQWLSENVLAGRHVLAVDGTHGKTAVSAMLAWILEQAGRKPGFLIGGLPVDFPVSARHTGSPHFVIEADEYDTAFFDKRSKFVHYGARTAILNNIEFDHADIFDDLAAIERQFHHFVRTVPRGGRIIANGADPVVERVLTQGFWSPVDRFGVQGGWEAGPIDEKGGFDVLKAGRPAGRIRWELSGDHNRLNALAAIAAAEHAGVSPAQAIDALHSFSGVRRRMPVPGRARGATRYDDFAHHPHAIRTTIVGLRQKAGQGRILAVFEPRSNTMKRGVLREALPGAFAAADLCYVYTAGLGWSAEETFAPLGTRVRCLGELVALVDAVVPDSRPGDHLLVMSNGGFGGGPQ